MASLRGRLTAALTLGMTLLVAVSALVAGQVAGRALAAEYDRALAAKASALVSLTEQRGAEVELHFADEFMPEFEAAEDPEYFELAWRDGRPLELSRSLARERARLPRLTEISAAPRFRDLTLPDGRRGRLVQVDFVPQLADESHPAAEQRADPRALAPDSGRAALTLLVARERERLDAQLGAVRLTLAVAVLATLAATLAFVRVIVRRQLAPLDAVRAQVEALDASSLDSRVTLPGAPDELRPVVGQLNALLARLEEAFARERRLSSDLAHELRTPIAELRALAEVGGRGAASDEAFFADALGIARQMERIVVQLLALARSESGQEVVRPEEVAAAEVVREAWQPLARQAEARRLALDLDVEEGLHLCTDRDKLLLVLSNLLANAVAYSPPGTTVRVRGRTEAGESVLEVANPTDSLAAEDLPRLFERFWRKDPARAGGEHAGLGLALVRALAGLLGARVEPALDGEVFRMTLRLPAGGAAPAVH